MNLSMASHLKLVPLVIRNDKKNFIVEDLTTGEFYEMPEICIDAINMIQNDILLQDIEIQLKQKYTNEAVDLLDFALQLLELHLIDSIDGEKVTEKQNKQLKPTGFGWLSPKAGRLFFNKFTLYLYLFLFVANLVIFIFHPNLFPRYKDFFIFDFMLLNIPIWIVVTLILVLFHEFGHILAIRSYNLPTKLEIGHRLFLIVFETDMSSAWKLHSKDRNKLYCAGLCLDTLTLFISLVSQLTFSNSLLIGIMRIIVLDTVIRMVYQLCIYMKTDLYYVFENCTGCYNLMENAQQLLRKIFFFQKSSTTNEIIFEGERKTVFFYTIFYIIGIVLSLSLYVIFYIPQVIYAFQKVLPGFHYPTTSLPFWDSTVFLLQILIGVILLLYSWIKKYRISS